MSLVKPGGPAPSTPDSISMQAGSVYGCFTDMPTCLMGYCCPCVLFGTNLKKAGISSSVAGVLAYLALAAAIALFSLLTVLHYIPEYLDRLHEVADLCQQNAADASGSGSQLSWGAAARPHAPAADQDSRCLVKGTIDQVIWMELKLGWLSPLACILCGLFFGYFRMRINRALGGAESRAHTGIGCLQHCMPCTHSCALCQEARALKLAGFGKGSNVPWAHEIYRGHESSEVQHPL